MSGFVVVVVVEGNSTLMNIQVSFGKEGISWEEKGINITSNQLYPLWLLFLFCYFVFEQTNNFRHLFSETNT